MRTLFGKSEHLIVLMWTCKPLQLQMGYLQVWWMVFVEIPFFSSPACPGYGTCHSWVISQVRSDQVSIITRLFRWLRSEMSLNFYTYLLLLNRYSSVWWSWLWFVTSWCSFGKTCRKNTFTIVKPVHFVHKKVQSIVSWIPIFLNTMLCNSEFI